jgi:DNA-directed RNA polymerase subunit RPC12/RpoP
MLDTDKTAYMNWIEYLRQLKQFSIKCPDCSKRILLEICIFENRKSARAQCAICGTVFYFELQPGQDREDLIEKQNQGKLAPIATRDLQDKKKKVVKKEREEQEDSRQQDSGYRENESEPMQELSGSEEES